MTKEHTKHLKEYEKLVAQKHILTDDLYTFYISLFTFHDTSVKQFESIILHSTLMFDTTLYPVITPQNLPFTEQILSLIAQSFKEVTAIIQKYQPYYSFDALLQQVDTNNLYKDCIIKLLSKDSNLEAIAINSAIDTDELIFIIVNVYKPLFVALRNVSISPETTFTEYNQAHCPFCGFFPDMAKIVEIKNNRRYLHCALCECEWEYKRVKCPICGNEDSTTLGYFSYEEDEKYRIDYCDTCKGYMKTIRIPKQYDEAQFDLTVENIVTNFLDASAIKKGYIRL